MNLIRQIVSLHETKDKDEETEEGGGPLSW